MPYTGEARLLAAGTEGRAALLCLGGDKGRGLDAASWLRCPHCAQTRSLVTGTVFHRAQRGCVETASTKVCVCQVRAQMGSLRPVS